MAPVGQNYHGVDNATNMFRARARIPLPLTGAPSHRESHLLVSPKKWCR